MRTEVRRSLSVVNSHEPLFDWEYISEHACSFLKNLSIGVGSSLWLSSDQVPQVKLCIYHLALLYVLVKREEPIIGLQDLLFIGVLHAKPGCDVGTCHCSISTLNHDSNHYIVVDACMHHQSEISMSSEEGCLHLRCSFIYQLRKVATNGSSI